MPPGARLRQEELAELFGPADPVREALRALEYEGLVTSEPHRGFTVTSLDADDVEEVYDLRIVLEGHALRLAVPLLTDDDLSELGQLYDEMTTAATPDEQLAAREHFYLRLYSVSGRPRRGSHRPAAPGGGARPALADPAARPIDPPSVLRGGAHGRRRPGRDALSARLPATPPL